MFTTKPCTFQGGLYLIQEVIAVWGSVLHGSCLGLGLFCIPDSMRTQALYDALQVPSDATQDQIKDSYKKLILKYHPDKNKDPDAPEKFRQVHDAYQVLGDPEKRFLYDRYGSGYTEMRKTSSVARLIAEVIIEVMFSAFVPFDTVSKRCKMGNFGVVPEAVFANNKAPSMMSMFNKIQREEGLGGLWRGNTTSITESILYAHLKDSLCSTTVTPMGQLAGIAVSQALTYPFDVICTCIRTRASTQGLWQTMKTILATSGTWGFYYGFKPFLMQNVILALGLHIWELSKANLWVVQKMREQVESQSYGTALFIKIAATFTKMALLSLITCPLKTIAVRMQVAAFLPDASLKALGLYGHAKNIIQTEGVGHLYTGYMADVIFGMTSLILSYFS